MYINPPTLIRGAASAIIAVQVGVAVLPGFTSILTHTERHLHVAVTLCAVAALIVIHFMSARPLLRIALSFFVIPALCADQLFIATKTFLPLFHERVAFMMIVPLAVLALSSFSRKGAFNLVRHSHTLRPVDHRTGLVCHRR